ncbi:gamma-mobile-trio protein GmtX [Variovorax ureilyticus]|uniref:Gamma-mobile-trio protein GmtX n=1 Tax=Variovorax ureilyticus TaxID=1836198 RepID=A0ABU8VR82_9BURK
MTAIHPDALYEELLKNVRHQSKRKGLEGLHKICKVQAEGSRDFSRSTLGKLCEVAGLFHHRMLYNQTAADYCALIAAWEKFSGGSAEKKSRPLDDPSQLAGLLHHIDDLAVRAIFQRCVVERGKLRHELNMVKAIKTVEVDIRPPQPVQHPFALPKGMLGGSAVQLTATEKEALEHAVSSALFETEGWKEGSHGEVVNHAGRTLFEVGYTRAIRKILASA